MPPYQTNNNVVLEGVKLAFRNFGGAAGRFNAEGKRSFGVLLNGENLEKVRNSVYAHCIAELKPYEEGDDPQPFVRVGLYFPRADSKARPPQVVLITDKIDPDSGEVTGQAKNNLNAATANLLDWAHIVNCDLVLRPFNWEYGGRTGIKPAVKSIYCTIEMDDLERKYSNLPTIGGDEFEGYSGEEE